MEGQGDRHSAIEGQAHRPIGWGGTMFGGAQLALARAAPLGRVGRRRGEGEVESRPGTITMGSAARGVWAIDVGLAALKALRLAPSRDGGPVEAMAFDYIEYPQILGQPGADP